MSVVWPPVGGVGRITRSDRTGAMPSRSVIAAEMTMGELPEGLFRVDGDDVVLAVAVQPAAKRIGIEGIDVWRGRLQSAVKAAPQKGAANEAVCELLAEAFEIPLMCIAIVAGKRSRHKSVRLQGVAADSVQARLEGFSGAQ